MCSPPSPFDLWLLTGESGSSTTVKQFLVKPVNLKKKPCGSVNTGIWKAYEFLASTLVPHCMQYVLSRGLQTQTLQTPILRCSFLAPQDAHRSWEYLLWPEKSQYIQKLRLSHVVTLFWEHQICFLWLLSHTWNTERCFSCIYVEKQTDYKEH